MVYPEPAGIPPTWKVTAWLLATLTIPVLTTVGAPPGPVMVHVTVLSCSPPGNVRFMPIDPVSWACVPP